MRLDHRFASSTLLLALVTSAVAAGANPPLMNPSFEVPGPDGPSTVNQTAVGGGAGHSAAAGWGVFHNTPGTTRTQLLGTTLLGVPGAMGRMIRVRTDGPRNGINQVTGPPGSGSPTGTASGWVYVNQGVVGMGSGNHGNTGIDVTTTTTGGWQFLQAPNGQSPMNQIIFYSVGGGADFFVELAALVEDQVQTDRPALEYSNGAFDERAIPGGGGHGPLDPGQVLYTEPFDTAADGNPSDAVDFFPDLEAGDEPDAQVDALANGSDAGFDDVVSDEIPLLFSVRGDAGAAEVALFREDPSGAIADEYVHLDLNALDAGLTTLDDLDAVEIGGPLGASDADFVSLLGDVAGASVFHANAGGLTPYVTPTQIFFQLAGALGFSGGAGDVDVDALMVKDTGLVGTWDSGDELLFSIRRAANFHGGEIVWWRNGAPAQFLFHGGHDWDPSFSVGSALGVTTNEVDAIEAAPVATSCDDADEDGVCDDEDNCREHANPDQRDTNSDGYGNRCDPDVDNGGAVGIPDFNMLNAQFGLSAGNPGYDPDLDFTGDDAVGIPDFSILRAFFGGPPGPSGLACAGTIPCP